MFLSALFRRPAKAPRARRHGFRPRLECLEDRRVPTILFTPQFGPENAVDQGSDKLNSPQVLLLFWGTYWQDGDNPLAQGIVSAVNSLFPANGPSTYLSALTQKAYGMDGQAHYANAIYHDSDPSNNFSGSNIRDVLTYEIDNSKSYFPDSDEASNGNEPIYVIVTPPGIQSEKGSSVGGYNAYAWKFEFDLFHPVDYYEFAWAGGKNLDPSNAADATHYQASLDAYTKILTHEVVEGISDPHEGKFQNPGGIRVSPGAEFNGAKDDSSQLCDYEAENYKYREPAGGVLVQSYWSQRDQAFIVPDGNVQQFVVNNGQLSVNGDQLGKNYDDTIVLDVGPNGGVKVTLNGETAQFEPGAISSVWVDPGGGVNTVDVLNTIQGVPVTVLGAGVNQVVVGDDSGSAQGIQGDVTVVNDGGTGGTSTLTVNDWADTQANSVTITKSAITGLAPATITYDEHDLTSLTINAGGDAAASTGSTFDVPSIPNRGRDAQTHTTLTSRGNDTVNVGDQHSLAGILGRLYVYNAGAHAVGNVGPATHTILKVDDSADTVGKKSVVIASDSLTGLAPGFIGYGAGDLKALDVSAGTGGKAGNTFAVQSTPNYDKAGTVTTTLSSQGPDSVKVGDAGILAGLQGGLTVKDPNGSTRLTVDDSADKAARDVVATDAALFYLAPTTVHYHGMQSVTVDLSGGWDDTVLLTPSPATTFAVNGDLKAFQVGHGALLRLNTNLLNTTPTLTPGGPGDGTWTFTGGFQPVSFTHLAVPVADVSTQVSVTGGKIVYNPKTKLYYRKVTIKNNSNQPIVGPLSLVLTGLSANAHLVNKTGVTAVFTPVGSPYIDATLVNNVLDAGKSVTLTLAFSDPSNQPITYGTRVLAGTGQR